MIHIYTGNGKGKTTAAFGLAMRACGQGLKVIIFQFLKPKELLCGEHVSIKNLKGIRLVRFSQMHPLFTDSTERPKACGYYILKKTIKKDFEQVDRAIRSNRYDMIVLDEIVNIVDQGIIKKISFIRFLNTIPKKIELVLTGRGDISEMERYADYVTIMVDKKHPFRKNTPARKGIEY